MQTNKTQIWAFTEENNRIEGIDLVEENFEPVFNSEQPKNLIRNYLHIKNSIEAYGYISENFNTVLGVEDIMVLHEIQMGDLLRDSDLGLIRKIRVGIKKRVFNEEAFTHNILYPEDPVPMYKNEFTPCTPPGEVRNRLDRFIEMFNNSTDDCLDVHYEFECIHPFVDGNGRVGRLLWLWRNWRLGGSKILLLDEYEEIGFHARRQKYYEAIQHYRDNKFHRRKRGKSRRSKRGSDSGLKKPRGKSNAEDAVSHV